MKSFLTLLMVCCLSVAWAQQTVPLKVSGRVFFGEGNQPARNVPVNVFTERGRTSVLTNLEGFYAIGVDVRVEAGAPYAKVTLVVDNFCNNIPIQKLLYVNQDSSVFKDVNFRICETTNPPPPRNECKAFFTHKVDPAAPQTVYFQNLSGGSYPIARWLWNFGDSTTSILQNPVHTYARSGLYVVSLTITAPGRDTVCTASFASSVYVRDTANCNCPRNYDPVCVLFPNGTKVLFPNRCLAVCAGYTEAQITMCRDTACVCPAVYDPVCVKLADGSILEFGNACEAACKGYTERDFIECRRDTCNCPTDEYVPVCVVFEGDTLTYGNACRAKCAGFDTTDFVQCDTTVGCNCPKILDPVCAVSPNGDTITFTNKCFAICKGYSPEALFRCRPNECICPEYYDPVCVIVNGDTLTFDNPCFARCKGFTDRDWFRCRRTDDCVCPLNFDPVCVKVNGQLKEFANACVAKCYGFSERDFVRCQRDTSDCNCDLYYEPVCAVGPNGDTITFSNKCFAACKGYEGTEIFRCRRDTSDRQDLCTAAFRAILQDSASLTVKFTDFAKALEGTILGWKWDFGDGTYGDSQNPVHTYARAGFYTITQYIATSTGCTSKATRTVYVGRGDVVEGHSCQAVFTFLQKPNSPNTIEFKNLSFGNITSILWEFGDGYTSTEKNPTHIYRYNGVFFVRLTVRSGDCVNTTSMVLFIDPNTVYDNECNALFLPVLFVDSLQIAFRNMSSSDAKTFLWNFGDNTTSTDFAPVHTYRQKGIYEITLTITTASGCINTFRAVLNLGTQNFTGNPEYRTLSTTDTDNAKVLQQFKVYPNPAKDELMLEFNAVTTDSYQIQIFSLERKLLQTSRQNAAPGSNSTRLDIHHLPAGMYLLRIQTDGQTKSVRFIKS